jgi:hypothetical protein
MCPVCYGDVRVLDLPCGHGMCRACTTRWFSVSETCPVCRTRVKIAYCSDTDFERVEHKRRRLSRLRAKGYGHTLTTNIIVTKYGLTRIS